MWVLIVLTFLIWFVGSIYLMVMLYYQLTRKEIYVPFIPADVKGMTAMCQAIDIKGIESIVDIGSGWGTILFFLIGKYPQLKLTGIEINPFLHVIAVLRKYFFHRNSDIVLLKSDASKVSYENYEIIFLFMLSPFVNKVLVPKFEKELKKGTKIISYVFRMKSKAFKETKISLPAHGWRSAVYLYEKK